MGHTSRGDGLLVAAVGAAVLAFVVGGSLHAIRAGGEPAGKDEAALDGFEKWAGDVGINRDAVVFLHTSSRGRVTAARKGVNKGEVLLHVPRVVALTSSFARQHGVGKQVPPTAPHPATHSRLLAAQLVAERRLGNASRWGGWLQHVVPAAPFDALRLHAGDVECLPAPARRMLREMADEAAAVHQLCTRVFPSCTEDEARWARATVATRAVPISKDGTLAIVPGADLMNHAKGTARLTRRSRQMDYAVVAGVDVLPGTEVHLDYHSAWRGHEEIPSLLQTFLKYGFVDEGFKRVMAHCIPPPSVVLSDSAVGGVGGLDVDGVPDRDLVACLSPRVLGDTGEGTTLSSLVRHIARLRLVETPAPAAPACSDASPSVLRLNALYRQTIIAAYTAHGGKPTDFLPVETLQGF